MTPAQKNPPVTAATIAAAITGLLAAFTSLTAGQLSAISAALVIVAAVVAQRFTISLAVPLPDDDDIGHPDDELDTADATPPADADHVDPEVLADAEADTDIED